MNEAEMTLSHLLSFEIISHCLGRGIGENTGN
jgi:hypothetical protein